MFARVSTFTSGPDATSTAPSEEIVRRALEMDRCLGVYYFTGREAGNDLAITLWQSEEAMTESREMATKIRTDISTTDKKEIAAVEEYEVTVNNLKS